MHIFQQQLRKEAINHKSTFQRIQKHQEINLSLSSEEVNLIKDSINNKNKQHINSAPPVVWQ